MTYVDTAAVQVLLGFVNSMAKANRIVTFSHLGDSEFKQTVATLGLSDYFVEAATASEETEDETDGLCPVF